MNRRTRSLAAVATGTAGLVLATGVALGSFGGTNAGGISAIAVQWSTDETSTNNAAAWVALPNASAAISGQGLVRARFSGESTCSGGAGYCQLRILLDGVEMNPPSGLNFGFDSTDGGTETTNSFESRSIERSRVVASGVHTAQVYYRVSNVATTFRLDDWTLALEIAPLPIP